MSNEIADISARFLGPQFLGLFKGLTLSTVAPIIIIVICTVVIVNILASLVADSPGPYPSYGRKLASAAADVWDNRQQYGFVSGRTLDTLGPLESVLDAISESVKKWEDTPLYTSAKNSAAEATSASANYIRTSPQFISNPSVQSLAGATSGKIRFQ